MRQTIARNQAEAAAAMENHRAAAKHDVVVGDVGTDYFHGRCAVKAVDARVVTLTDEAGREHRVYRDQWLGLVLAPQGE